MLMATYFLIGRITEWNIHPIPRLLISAWIKLISFAASTRKTITPTTVDTLGPQVPLIAMVQACAGLQIALLVLRRAPVIVIILDCRASHYHQTQDGNYNYTSNRANCRSHTLTRRGLTQSNQVGGIDKHKSGRLLIYDHGVIVHAMRLSTCQCPRLVSVNSNLSLIRSHP